MVNFSKTSDENSNDFPYKCIFTNKEQNFMSFHFHGNFSIAKAFYYVFSLNAIVFHRQGLLRYFQEFSRFMKMAF